METEIRISDNCKTCAYSLFAPVAFMNSFSGQWKCRLFSQDLFLSSGERAILKNEQPEQCGECKLLLKRHQETPEFQG